MKKYYVLLGLLVGLLGFSFSVLASEKTLSQMNENEEVSIDMDSNDSYNMKFVPSRTGFYDLTVSKPDDVVINADIADDNDYYDYNKLTTSGSYSNFCFLVKDKAYNLCLSCEANDGSHKMAEVKTKLSFNSKDINTLSSQASFSCLYTDKLVYSFKTSAKGMYSICTDANKEYIGELVKKDSISNKTEYSEFGNYMFTINNTYNVELEANTQYYIIYDFSGNMNDSSVPNAEVNGSISIKNRKVTSVKFEMVPSNTYTSFDDAESQNYKCSVAYDDNTLDEKVGVMTFHNYLNIDGYGVVQGYNEPTAPGNYTITGDYFGVKFTCPFVKTSGYKYCVDKGVNLKEGATNIIDKSTAYDNKVKQYYKFTPSKTGWYKVKANINNINSDSGVCNLISLVKDSKDKYCDENSNIGYYLKAKQTYAIYIGLFDVQYAKDDISFTIVNSNHKHKKTIEKGYPATYTHTGMTNGTFCSVCNEVLTKQKVIAKKKLATPKIVKLISKKNGVNIQWNKIKDASRYVVYRYNSKTKKYVKIATLTANKLSFIDKNFKFTKQNKSYAAKVVAVRIENKKQVAIAISKVKTIKKR